MLIKNQKNKKKLLFFIQSCIYGIRHFQMQLFKFPAKNINEQ